jgi:hypothetical protein
VRVHPQAGRRPERLWVSWGQPDTTSHERFRNEPCRLQELRWGEARKIGIGVTGNWGLACWKRSAPVAEGPASASNLASFRSQQEIHHLPPGAPILLLPPSYLYLPSLLRILNLYPTSRFVCFRLPASHRDAVADPSCTKNLQICPASPGIVGANAQLITRRPPSFPEI